VVRVIAHAPAEPFYPLYDNRTQRLVVLPALAVRLWRGLSAGIGFNYLAGLDGNVAAAEGATRALEARVDEQIRSVLAVNLGVRWQLRPELALALVYRQAFAVPFRTVANNRVSGEPIDLDVDAQGLYTPHTVVAGVAWQARPSLMLSLDVGWQHFTDWRGPYVTVSSELPLVGAIAAAPPRLSWSDTGVVRAGADWTAMARGNVSVHLRGGYGFESSPIPQSQPGVTNLLDGHKHHLALGAGGEVRWGQSALRLDVHGQLSILQPVTLVKKIAPAGEKPDPASALSDEIADDPQRPSTLGTQISNPGYPSISSGGFVWALGFTLTVRK
jgi:hypothetical protein